MQQLVRLPDFTAYQVVIRSQEPSPEELNLDMQVAAETSARSAYEHYRDKVVNRQLEPCMAQRGYRLQ